MNFTYCNTTAEDMGISEEPLVGPLRFHDLAVIIAAATALLAMLISFYLIWMHALNYTKPDEQKYIIRILLMVPIYAASSFLQLKFYHHAIYYEVISDCYEAFAISSFFALLCQYTAADLHQQKHFFRQLQPVKPWVWPLTWLKKCCGGDRGPWRTPKSGLTWFNIIWIGIYHYCFIRVAMTITAVVTQYYGRYCESSNSPYFSHIWCTTLDSVAVSIAMYCVIQFYYQLRNELSAHRPFLKVVAIKGVIFLSFWQSTAISLATSEFNIISTNAKLSYPDISVGISALLLCVEMLFFAILHIWAYPWKPYREDAKTIFYPIPNPNATNFATENVHILPAGGTFGLKAIWDALNLWDVIKAFGRGMRWLFVGVKHRHEDVGYHKDTAMDIDMDGRSAYGMGQHIPQPAISPIPEGSEEGAGLIAHAQDNPTSRAPSPFLEYDRYREDQPYEADLGYRGAAQQLRQAPQSYEPQPTSSYQYENGQETSPHAVSTDEYYVVPSPSKQILSPTGYGSSASDPLAPKPPLQAAASGPRDSRQAAVGNALWGPNPHQHPGGSMM